MARGTGSIAAAARVCSDAGGFGALEFQMPYTFIQSFPYLLNRVGVRMGELFSGRLRAYGLTLPMYRVMAVLRQEGPQRLGDLSSMTSTELSTLSRLVTSMKKDGYVSRVRPEDDGRTVEISLTPKGAALVEQLMPLASEYETVGTRSFTEEEIAWLKAALVQIYDNLDALAE
jgi:DNA-binding MarR family transcriptional regulator